jgi:tRNA-specific 2-thiouridylase
VCASNFVDKYLSSTQCLLRDFNWINGEIPLNKKVDIRFRHRQELIRGEFSIDKKTNKFLLKYIKTNGVTPGQFAVLYQKDICLGGGIVVNTIPTL